MEWIKTVTACLAAKQIGGNRYCRLLSYRRRRAVHRSARDPRVSSIAAAGRHRATDEGAPSTAPPGTRGLARCSIDGISLVAGRGALRAGKLDSSDRPAPGAAAVSSLTTTSLVFGRGGRRCVRSMGLRNEYTYTFYITWREPPRSIVHRQLRPFHVVPITQTPSDILHGLFSKTAR